MITSCEYKVKKIIHPHAIKARVPGSKSITNRALLIAALANGRSVLKGVLFSDDSRHFLQALKDLGFDIVVDETTHTVEISGCGGAIPASFASVNVGSAGTAARFLTALLGLSEGRYRMDASEQMKARPMRELLSALESLGARIEYEGEEYHFPYIIGRDYKHMTGEQDEHLSNEPDRCTGSQLDNNTGTDGCRCTDDKQGSNRSTEITIDVDKSSQFLSALLITSVLFPNGITIHVTGSHGMAYVRMTVAMMRQFGLDIIVSEDERTYTIPVGAHYEFGEYEIEPDLSAACYFYAAGAILGVPAQVIGVHRECLQGDIEFLSVLRDMGCVVTEDADGVILEPNPCNRECHQDADEIADGKEQKLWAAGNVITEVKCGKIGTSSDTGVRLHGGSWDLSSFSDQALTLAAIAPFADSVVEIRGIGHIRYQECDRINAIMENLQAMGVRCEEADGVVRIYPAGCKGNEADRALISDSDGVCSRKLHGARIQTYDDHRVAMAFTIPGLRLDGQVILNPSCCSKTFEDFFEVLEDVVY